jgi:inhibitor of KinA sporulation pathway (predicted exonuclease)
MKNMKLANVIDVELTCYPDGVFPPGETQEIIEIGVCEIDLQELKIVGSRSYPVVPTMSSVSPFCTELTGWTYAKLKKQGFSFEKACSILAARGALNRLVVTDSDNELSCISRQCELMSVANPFGSSLQNVATLFSILTRQTRNLSLEEMLAHVGLEFEGRPHRAADDATNIARLFIRLMESGRAGVTPHLPLLIPKGES